MYATVSESGGWGQRSKWAALAGWQESHFKQLQDNAGQWEIMKSEMSDILQTALKNDFTFVFWGQFSKDRNAVFLLLWNIFPTDSLTASHFVTFNLIQQNAYVISFERNNDKNIKGEVIYFVLAWFSIKMLGSGNHCFTFICTESKTCKWRRE